MREFGQNGPKLQMHQDNSHGSREGQSLGRVREELGRDKWTRE